MTKRRIVVSLVFLFTVLLCAGLVGFNFFKEKMIADFFANMQQPPQAVSAAKVEAKTWTPSISAIGTARAANGVELAFETPGIVKEIKFKANQSVRQGDVLVQLDDTVERADIQDVQAAVKTAESSFDRAKSLSSRGYGTEANLDQASALLAAARSRLARLEATIEQKALKAPFSGVIGIPRVDVGQYLQPGSVIASFQDLDSMKVDFTVPEQMADDVKLDQEVRLGVNESDLPFKGKITGKDPRVDPKTRLVSVQALIEDNKDRALLPGQFVHVEVILPQEPNVVTVPQTAVITSLYGDYVYTIEKEEKAGKQVDVARQVFVKTGRRRGGSLEVLSGIQVGQQVVASGQNKLQAGATVKIDNSIDVTKLDAPKLANGQ
jgi:membrane fusion protein, multidrug efflux system